MKTFTKDELTQILKDHKSWYVDNTKGQCANLSGADLSGATLYGATLYGANLSRADLSRANLSGAYLSRANLYGADLSGANLSDADLRGAYLSRAYLIGADLRGADLRGANLRGAYLSGANLYGADLYGAKGIIQITTMSFTILVTRTHAKIGCEYKTHKEWVATTSGQAKSLGLPEKYYKTYRMLVQAALKQLKAQELELGGTK